MSIFGYQFLAYCAFGVFGLFLVKRIVWLALDLSNIFLMCSLLLIACGLAALSVWSFVVGAASISSHSASLNGRSAFWDSEQLGNLPIYVIGSDGVARLHLRRVAA